MHADHDNDGFNSESLPGNESYDPTETEVLTARGLAARARAIGLNPAASYTIELANGSTIRVFDDGSDVHLEGAPWAGQWIELPPTDDTNAMLALWDFVDTIMGSHEVAIPDGGPLINEFHCVLSLARRVWAGRPDVELDTYWPEGFACCRWCGYSVEPDETCDCREEL